jgi:hypothetical protein
MKRKNIISTIAMLAVTLMVSGCSGLTGGSDSSGRYSHPRGLKGLHRKLGCFGNLCIGFGGCRV